MYWVPEVYYNDNHFIKKESRLSDGVPEESYRLAIEGSNDGIWDINIRDKKTYFSKRLLEIIGYPNEVQMSLHSWLKRLHREDLKPVLKEIRNHLSGKKTVFSKEFRLRSLTGDYRWVLCRGKAVFDEHKKPIRIAGTITDINERKQKEKKMLQLAYFDPLTGLPNRTLLGDRINAAIASSRITGQMFAIIFLDLDQFKSVNDFLGHAYGDLLIKMVAEKLVYCTREVDTVTRLGGDEFIILLQKIEQIRDITKVVERISNLFQSPWELCGREFVVTASIGIAVYPKDGTSMDELINNADEAMYYAKQNGKNAYAFYSQQLNEKSRKRKEMELALKDACISEQWILQYQPVREMAGDNIFEVESLIRWDHPNWGILQPVEFFELAEELGLTVPIAEWQIRNVCSQIKAWNKVKSTAYVSMCLTLRQLSVDGFVGRVKKTASSAGIDPSMLCFYISEETFSRNAGKCIAVMSELKAAGFRIGISGLGGGQAYLECLSKVDWDLIKLSPSLIDLSMKSQKGRTILRGVVNMAHLLGIPVIGCSVDCEEQYRLLKETGCEGVQGNFLCKEVSGEEIGKMLAH